MAPQPEASTPLSSCEFCPAEEFEPSRRPARWEASGSRFWAPTHHSHPLLPFLPSRGVGAMEIVAMDMKVSGMYIARQLSFSGVTFRIEEIPLDPEYKLVYNKAAQLVSPSVCCASRPGQLCRLGPAQLGVPVRAFFCPPGVFGLP